MNSSSFGYLIRLGVINTWLNRLMSLASIAILTACLILTGSASLLMLNVRDVFVAIENQNEMVVYIDDGADSETIAKLGENIKSINGVSQVVYVSKEDALKEQKEYMGTNGALLDGLENDNPLPASYRVTLSDLFLLDDIVTRINVMNGVDSISAPTYLAETLTGIQRVLIIFGAVIISVLVVASVVVISNTIRLTVFARRREINIMKYVGATNSFIRLPFTVEGCVIGIASAVISFIATYGLYNGISELIGSSSMSWLSNMASNTLDFADVWYYLLAAYLVIALMIGVFGSTSAMRKHLKV